MRKYQTQGPQGCWCSGISTRSKAQRFYCPWVSRNRTEPDPTMVDSSYGDWAQGLPHAERVWYHYTNCPLADGDQISSIFLVSFALGAWIDFCGEPPPTALRLFPFPVLQSTTLPQSTAPVLLYYKVLLQHYKVLLQHYAEYYRVLLQYYPVLQSITPVLLRAPECYSSSVRERRGTGTALPSAGVPVPRRSREPGCQYPGARRPLRRGYSCATDCARAGRAAEQSSTTWQSPESRPRPPAYWEEPKCKDVVALLE